MATQFSIIFDRALTKMREHGHQNMIDSEIYQSLFPYLKSAQSDFARICVEDLNKLSADKKGYEADLSEDSIEILALGIVNYWMMPYVADSDKLRNAIGTKNFTSFSPANLLSTIKDVRLSIESDYEYRINKYSFIHGDMSCKRAGDKK